MNDNLIYDIVKYLDFKSTINFAEVNKTFFNFIRESPLMKIFLVKYYNSLFPPKIDENSVHIGSQTWLRCDLLMPFPGIKNIKTPVISTKCLNSAHYVNNKSLGLDWDTKKLFVEIARRRFILQKMNGMEFTEYHQERLSRLYAKENKIKEEIKRLELIKLTSESNLAEVYGSYLTKTQIESYYEEKNRILSINEETEFGESSESNYESDS